MKKTLIALAAVAAATGAMAQSTVSISGLLEIGAAEGTKTTTQARGTTDAVNVKTSNTARHNTYNTSVINFTASEDMGGGLRATAVMISGVGDGFAARERTLALSGDFGTGRLGRFVPAAAVGFHAFSGAGSATLAGSIYGMSTATNAVHRDGASFERQNNVIQYTSANFGGLVANVAIARNSTDNDNRYASTTGTQTSAHVGYTSGPLGLGFGTNSRTDKVEETAAGVDPTVAKGRLTWAGASYDLGVARVMATTVQRKAKDDLTGLNTTDARVNALGVAVPMDAFTLRASMYRGKDKRALGAADNMKLSGYQVGATYALSPRTSVIAAMGVNNIKRDGADAVDETRKVKAHTIALNHTF